MDPDIPIIIRIIVQSELNCLIGGQPESVAPVFVCVVGEGAAVACWSTGAVTNWHFHQLHWITCVAFKRIWKFHTLIYVLPHRVSGCTLSRSLPVLRSCCGSVCSPRTWNVYTLQPQSRNTSAGGQLYMGRPPGAPDRGLRGKQKSGACNVQVC